jgi:MFS family permease
MPKLRLPFFYGWLIVLGGAVGGSFMLGSAQFATSTFLVPMQEELGWSQTLIYGAFSVRILVGGLLGAFLGPLIDHRWAPRVIMPIGAVLMGVSFLVVKWAESPLAYYLGYGVVGAIGLSITSVTMWEALSVKWFVRKRIKAIMWVAAGAASGPLVFPMTLTLLINAVGWRDAWFWFGIGTIAVLLPLALLVRTSPEDMGLLPDGDTETSLRADAAAGRARPADEFSFTRKEAMRNRSFWLMTAAMTVPVIGLTGYQSHWIPYFREIGFSAQMAAAAVMGYGFFNVTGRFVWTWVASRFPIQRVMVVQAFIAASGVVLMLSIQNNYMLFFWSVFQGLNLASYFALQAIISANYFGRDHIGSIRGVMFPFANGMRAAAPLFLGATHDWMGSYRVPFSIIIVAWISTGLMMAALKKPKLPQRDAQTGDAQAVTGG